jgi:single-stranded-DNA-specific exonuclease
MESNILPVDIMLESDWAKAADMVEFVMQNNSTRVQLQAEAEKEALDLLQNWPHEDFVFVFSRNFHRGVIGLIATKLSQTLNKVSLVGSLGEDGMIVGSARLPSGKEVSLIDVLSSGQEYLARFGGHMAAAGFELASHYAEKFIVDINNFFQLQRSGASRPMELEYDLATSLSLINPQLLNWHDFMGPYGTGFPLPIFRFDDVFILQCKELRGGHLKMKLKDSFGLTQIDALLFSPTDRQREAVMNAVEGVDLLGELQWNYFAGKKSIQILVKDVSLPCR